MILKAILFSMVVASVSFFLTHSELTFSFRQWLRQYLFLRQIKKPFFADLFDCPYCLGHWLVAALLLTFPIRLFGIFAPVDYLFTWIVISWAAGLQSMAMSRLLGE